MRKKRVMLFAVLVSLAVVAGIALLTWKEEIGLLFNDEGYHPTLYQYSMIGGLLIAFATLLILFAMSLETVKSDYADFINRKRSESSPPIIDRSEQLVSAKDAAKLSYSSRDFSHLRNFETSDGTVELWKGSEEFADGAKVYRTSGVLIYQDGSATQFSVAVLFAQDAWAIGEETKVARQQVGRPVAIHTALNRPLVKELIQTNDYILGIGLASSSPTVVNERNQHIADARAFNLGYAIGKLKIKEPDRIRGISFGFATTAPSLPSLEPRQRAVVIVGVNASRDVKTGDVVRGAAMLVTLDGVDLTQYSRGPDHPVMFRKFDRNTEYMTTEQAKALPSPKPSDGWTLPAVPQDSN